MGAAVVARTILHLGEGVVIAGRLSVHPASVVVVDVVAHTVAVKTWIGVCKNRLHTRRRIVVAGFVVRTTTGVFTTRTESRVVRYVGLVVVIEAASSMHPS